VIDSNQLLSPLYPSSWISPIHGRIRKAMTKAFDEIILRDLATQLGRRAEKIVADPGMLDTLDMGLSVVAIEKTREFYELRNFVSDLQNLERYSKKYNDFRRFKRLDEIREVVKYLFNRELPANFDIDKDYYSEEIEELSYERFDFTPYHARAIDKADTLLSRLQDRLFTYNMVLRNVRTIILTVDDLARGVGGGEPVASMRELYLAIQRTQSTLASPEIAWMKSEDFVPGDPLNLVLADIDTLSSTSLNPDLHTKFLDSCNAKFHGLKQDLAAGRSETIGYILKHQDYQNVILELAPQVDSLRLAMEGLFGQKFMRVSTRPVLANLQRPGVRVLWSNDQLGEALGYYDPYKAFISDGIAKFPAGLQPAANAAARYGLEASMLDLIKQAQRTEPSRRSEEDIRSEVKSLGGASANLKQLENVFEQLQLRASGELKQMLRNQVNNLLGELTAFLGSEGLYTVPQSKIDAWDGEEGLAMALLDARNPNDVSGFFGTWRDRIQFLAKEYATPLIDFLEDQGLAGGGNTWKRMLQELHKYENKVPGNSVSVVEDLFLDLNDITLANYTQKLDRKSTGDYFLDKREELRRQVYNRCYELIIRKARTSYLELKKRFNDLLAGRFPFSETTPEALQDEVSLDEVRDFVGLFDPFIATYSEVWTGWNRPTASASEREAVRFLEQMSAVRKFLAPMIDAESDKVPQLDVDVEFRANQRVADGSNQIIEWKLDLGSQHVSSDDASRRTSWSIGDRTRLTLRWAMNAPTVPTGTAASSTKLATSIRVRPEERTVEYTFTDPWSLVRFMREYPYSPQSVSRSGSIKPNLLEFQVMTTAVADDPDQPNPTFLPNAPVKLFVRIGVLGANKKDRLALPYFPRSAPELK
jgi:hypothetical protein